MCGIAAIFHPSVPKPVDAARVRTMADAQAHCGPDGGGVWTAPASASATAASQAPKGALSR